MTSVVPANTWRFKGVEVGTFAKTADATYTADVKLGQIYSDLGMSDKDEAAPSSWTALRPASPPRSPRATI